MENTQVKCSRFYALYDEVAEEFMPLFRAQNDKVAVRMLKDTVKTNPAHCEDLSLFFVCEFSLDYSQVFFSTEVNTQKIGPRTSFVNGLQPVMVAHIEIDENNQPKVIEDTSKEVLSK